MSKRKAYPSDMSEEQWKLIEKLVPEALPGGRPAKYERREIVNAILYVLRRGCAWRMMPHDLPQWETPYVCFTSWSEDGTWELIEEALRRRVRKAEGKKPAPTAAIMDCQAVKTSDQGGPRGFDVAKQTAGRKRHILVDALGLIWLTSVTAASVQDRDGAQLLLSKIFQRGLGRLRLIWADTAYKAAALTEWIKTHLPRRGLRLQIIERDP
jgi:putative transposase